MNALNPRGNFFIEKWEHGELLDYRKCHNDTTNEGKTRFLNVGFHRWQPIYPWYVSLIDSIGYTTVASTDTYTKINQSGNGWIEFTAYTDTNNSDSGTTRPTWITDAAVSKTITNSTKSIFTCTTNGTVNGLFVVGGSLSSQVKDDYGPGNNVLWATSVLSPYAVSSGTILRVIYAIES
jgi:hypothetical protein